MSKQQNVHLEMKRYNSSTWVVVDEALVDVGQLLPADVSLGVRWGFEVKVVFAVAVKLRGGDVHPDHHLVREAGLLDGGLQQIQSWRTRRHKETQDVGDGR